ncbi:LuxR C-terminal-related transcriptional regulator [Amycolatopsis magusensis]|uniref:LuxR C-terminal-related transcriptional regulator n=1 Tax=Amycolatopsis magusensis TaxID=882444 RepID=UPI0037881FD7
MNDTTTVAAPLVSMTPQLAGSTTSFIGRSTQIAAARELLHEFRVVTLTGPGGVGKTRLLTQLAAQLADSGDFPGGVVVVGLGDLSAGDDRLASTIARRAGLGDNAADDPLIRLIRHVGEQQTLLMLDNCEHLLGEVGDGPVPRLLNTLLAATTTLTVMATSRMKLGVHDETLLDIPPLRIGALNSGDQLDDDAHEALRLLIDRVAAVHGTITSADYPLAGTLCRMLDGIPLAIEIAAGLLEKNGMTLQEIVDHPDLLRLLDDGPSDQPHHRTMRATMSWSYELLREPEQRLFRLLSIFEAGFDLDAARSIGAAFDLDPDDIQGLLGRLVRKSLLVGENRGGRTRYRLLELVRKFAQHLDTGDDERAALSNAHAHYYAGLAAKARRLWFGPDEAAWLDSTIINHPNSLTAQRHLLSTPDTATSGMNLAIDAVSTRAYVSAGNLNDALRLLARNLESHPAQPSTRHITALSMSMWVAALQGNGSLATSLLDQVTDAARALNCFDTDGAVLYSRGTYHFLTEPRRAHARKSLDLLARAEMVLREQGAEGDAFMAGLFSAMATTFLAGRTDAFAATERILSLAQAAQAPWCLSWALWTRAVAELLYDDADQAATLAKKALAIQRRISDKWGPTWTIWLIALIAIKRGEHDTGAQLLGGASMAQQLAQTSVRGMPTFLRVQEKFEDHARSELGDEMFDRQFATGEAMTREPGERIYALAARPLTAHTPAVPDQACALTTREQQVAALVAEEHDTRRIATVLGISPRTVETHIGNIYDKLHLDSRVGIARWVGRNIRASRETQPSNTGSSA